MRRGRKIALAILASLMAVGAAAGAAYGVLVLTDLTRPGSPAQAASLPSTGASPTTAAAPEPVVAPTPNLTAKPEPKPLLRPGDTGVEVRELQARLSQRAWFVPPMTGEYGRTTRTAVLSFQHRRGVEATGEVYQLTWRRLVRLTREPTQDEMFNRPGRTMFGPGDSGRRVREIQARLRQIGWLFGDVSDSYGKVTRDGVSGFQAKRTIPVTGKVDRRTLDLLEAMTVEPTADELANREPDPADGAPLDPRCTTGRALCIDKSSSSLRWVVNGKVLMSVDVRFGAEYSPTREGVFRVGWKDQDHVSELYGSAMPYSMFFSGGQAVHYSSDFAASGYSGASHGCVNVRDYDAVASLFDKVAVGDRVVVYWS